MLKRLLLLVTVANAAAALPAGAQIQPAALDLGAGVWNGRGGSVLDRRTGVVFDALISWRALALRRSNVVIAVNAADAETLDHGDSCLFDLPNNRCAPDYPQFTSLGVLGGLEAIGAAGTVRALVGPGIFSVDGAGSAGGVQARIDVATPSVYHVALIAVLRGALVPSFRGDAYQVGSAGLGIRIH